MSATLAPRSVRALRTLHACADEVWRRPDLDWTTTVALTGLFRHLESFVLVDNDRRLPS